MLSFLMILLSQPMDALQAKTCCAGATVSAPAVSTVSLKEPSPCGSSGCRCEDCPGANCEVCKGGCEQCKAMCGDRCQLCTPDDCKRCCGGDCQGCCGEDCKSCCGGAKGCGRETTAGAPAATKVRAETGAARCGCKKQSSRS
jgi:hypothetical protein